MREHKFSVHDVNENGHVLGWDGDRFFPSVAEPLAFDTCTFILKAGHMHFAEDCKHSLAGQIIPLPCFPLS
jgi:hypothetical protein